ncbi:MAG: hypothetical protein QOJ80_726 [Mycobacterium sp.]|nr:hypothetical protein [Mycobacterium sp.]
MRKGRLTRRVAASLGIAAVVSMGALTACGGNGPSGPSSTTPPTTSTSPSATEKSISPTGGNLFTPPVKAPPAPTATPAHGGQPAG